MEFMNELPMFSDVGLGVVTRCSKLSEGRVNHSSISRFGPTMISGAHQKQFDTMLSGSLYQEPRDNRTGSRELFIEESPIVVVEVSSK